MNSRDIKLDTGEIDGLLNKMGQYESMLDELSKLNEFLTTRAKTSEEKSRQLECSIDAQQITIQEMEVKLQKSCKLQSEVIQLTSDIEILNQAILLSTQSNKTLSEQLTQNERELSEFKQSFDKVVKEKSDLNFLVEEGKIRQDLSESKILLKDEEVRKLTDLLSASKMESEQIGSLQSTIYDLEAKVRYLEEEKANLMDEKRAIADSLNRLEESKYYSIQEVCREKEEIAEKLSQSSLEIGRLKNRVEEKDKETDALAEKIRELKKSQSLLVDLEVDLEEYRQKVDRLASDRDHWKGQVRGTQASNEAGLRHDLEQATEKTKLLSNRNKELESELKNKKLALQNLTEKASECSVLMESEIKLNGQLHALRDELVCYSRENEKLKSTNSGLESKIAGLAILTQTLSAKNAEILELENGLANLQAANKELRMKMINHSKEATTFKSPIDNGNTILARELETLTISSRLKDELIAQLQEKLKDHESLRATLNNHEESNHSSRMQIDKLKAQHSITIQDLEKANLSITVFNSQIKTTQEQIELLKAENSAKDTLLMVAGEENKSLLSRLKASQKTIESLGELTDEVSGLKMELHQTKEELYDTKHSLKHQKDRYQQLEKSCAIFKEEAEREGRNYKRAQNLVDELRTEVMGASAMREELSLSNEKLAAWESAHQLKVMGLEEQITYLNQRLEKNNHQLVHNSAQISETELMRDRLNQVDQLHNNEVSELRQKIIELQNKATQNKATDAKVSHSGIHRSDDSEDCISGKITEKRIDNKDRVVLKELSTFQNDHTSAKFGSEDSHFFHNSNSPITDKKELEKEVIRLREKIVLQEEYIQKELRNIREIREKSVEMRKSQHNLSPNSSKHREMVDYMRLDSESLYGIIARKESIEKELRRTITNLQREVDCLKEELRKLLLSKDNSEQIDQLQ